MRWSELQAGDVILDTEYTGNDFILVTRDEDSWTWLCVADGRVRVNVTSLAGKVILGWEVVRGGQTVWAR